MTDQSLKVISISRRIEMIGFITDQVISFLKKRCGPERTHSLVIWSKKPENLIEHRELRRTLERYDQIFIHFTISGMGGSYLEPGIPSLSESISLLPDLVKLTGSPERIRIRFDPIVHLRLPSNPGYTNLPHFTRIAGAAEKSGIRDLIVSWMETYPKVVRRLGKMGMEPLPITKKEYEKEARWITQKASETGVRISGCCTPVLTGSKCINGNLLTSLHPEKKQASLQKAGGQRALCGCTKSWDIGWYYPCPGGCLYCYARPVEFEIPRGKAPV